MKRKTLRGRRTTSTPQKPSEGSPKQVPPLGVLLRFLTSQVGYLTREKYAQKYDLTKVHAACTFVNWPSDSWKLRSKVSNDQCTCCIYTCELGKRLTKTRSRSLRFLTSQSGKLRSKVAIEQGAHSGYLFGMALWLVETTLKSMIWPSRVTAARPMIWSKDSQKHDPLADKKTCYLNSL